jgi:hypothetical protein
MIRRICSSALLACLALAYPDPSTNGALAQIGTDAPSSATGQDSPLKATGESIPDDVVALLGWAGGGAGDNRCFFQQSDRLEMYGAAEFDGQNSCVLTVNEVFGPPVMLPEMGWRDAPIEVEVRRPDGSIFLPAKSGYEDIPLWPIDPGSQLGQYRVIARQDDRVARGAFLVVARGESPLIRIAAQRGPAGEMVALDGNQLPGTMFLVTLAGFQPGQDVKLALYQGSHYFGFTFKTVLARIRMDDRGEGSYVLRTALDDPLGSYTVQTVPASQGTEFPIFQGAPFCLAREGVWDDCSARESIEDLARTAVVEANRIWASAIGPQGSASDLECVFGDDALTQASAQVRELHARGLYVTAQLNGPIRVLNAVNTTAAGTQDIEQVDAYVREQWDARLYQDDGKLLDVLPAQSEQHYVIVKKHVTRPSKVPGNYPESCGTGWVIVSADASN